MVICLMMILRLKRWRSGFDSIRPWRLNVLLFDLISIKLQQRAGASGTQMRATDGDSDGDGNDSGFVVIDEFLYLALSTVEYVFVGSHGAEIAGQEEAL